MNEEMTAPEEELLADCERAVRERPDDVPATQAVVCILLAAGLFCAQLISPAVGSGLFARLTALVSDKHELLRNPLELIFSLL